MEAFGLSIPGRSSKTVSDALRWEVRKGRVVRLDRSRYRTGSMPRSTEWWIRTQLAAYREIVAQIPAEAAGLRRPTGHAAWIEARTRNEMTEVVVERTAVNPWEWSVSMGFNQGEVVTRHSRTLFCAGQTAVDADGTPQHAGDMAAQISLALDNLESVLGQAEMGLGNVVRLNVYTTDVDGFFEQYGVLASRTAAAQAAPPGTLLGVARLAYPELMVELEATAVA